MIRPEALVFKWMLPVSCSHGDNSFNCNRPRIDNLTDFMVSHLALNISHAIICLKFTSFIPVVNLKKKGGGGDTNSVDSWKKITTLPTE